MLLITGCTSSPAAPVDTTPPDRTQSRTALPDGDTTVVDGADAVGLAVATSRAIYQSAPAVVLIALGDTDDVERAGTAAVGLGVPLLVAPAAPAPSGSAEPSPTLAPAGGQEPDRELRAELTRLEPRTVIAVGAAAEAWAASASLSITPLPESVDAPVLADVKPPAPLESLLVLARGDESDAAAVATARASGARVLMLSNPDPRATSESIKSVAAAPIAHVLAIGSAFGPADQLRRRLVTAATGVELPGGGQLLFPGRRMVALYGHPGDTVLGSLGEQPLDAAIARAKQVAGSYSSLVGEPVVPTFEIIATVASSGAGADGNYSNETPVATLKPWVDAARAAGVYVVLDLQPGRSDFLSQAKLYADLLAQPHVGLALDPEWRLKPDQVHMVQIGSVSAEEINQTGQWLAQFTREHNLPQKLLMLHQFTLAMISNRQALVTNYDELQVVIHADGFGSPGAKMNTWNALHLNAPANIHWGWKNFYDEDIPTFTPQQTMAVSPAPVFVSYQ
jgi:hypothetical protein